MLSSLHREVDGDTIAAEVIMLRAASTKAVILVEGYNDEKVYGHFIDDNKCDIVICYGHENACEALIKLESYAIQGILCIVDADFSAFISQNSGSANLLQTDDHDLEVMLFRSSAFDKVLSELGSPDKIKKFTDKGQDPRLPIWRSAHKLGIFRLYAVVKNLNLKFKEISFKFVDRRSLSIDINLMIKTVFDKSQKSIDCQDEIRNYIDQWLGKIHDHCLPSISSVR